MESLELVEIDAHGLKELVLLGATTADARFVNNVEHDSGEDLLIKDLPPQLALWCLPLLGC